MKFKIFVICLLFFMIFSFSNAFGEMEHDSSQMMHDPSKDFADLLKDEDESQFFSNQESGDFHEIFIRKATKDPTNSIRIESGTTVRLTGPLERTFSTILVEGHFRIFDTGDSGLTVQKIIVAPGGSLTIGNNLNPIESEKKVEIILGGNNEGEVGIFVFGNFQIHGAEVGSTFVGLQEYARKWDKRLIVDSEVYWDRDDEVIITSPGDDTCLEISKISKIVKRDIFLQTQLTCSHIGKSNTENPIISHVALLSRNVIISSDDENNRGSVNFFHGSYGYIKYAQFDHLGPKEVLGRYPIHFHHLKDSSRGIEVIGNSITNSDNRWITIHNSNGILVKNNVGYYSQGHGFFLEDGTEFNNIFENNIGIVTKQERLRSDGASSIFWTLNPMNVFRNNVAVAAPYWGYFFDVENIQVNTPSSQKLNLRSLPSLEFENNIAYNNRHGGIKIFRPTISESETQSSEIIISNFHAMGSLQETENHFGVRISGSNITVSDSFLNNYKFGIHLEGKFNQVLNTTIKMDGNFEPDADISGIVVAGSNNLIEDSQIQGYVSKNNNNAADISIPNNQNKKQLFSAKIINTKLLDLQPFYFGSPANDKSFLEIYGYDAPFAKQKLPENFMLKKIGSEEIEERGEYNILEFDAMLKLIPDSLNSKENESNETMEFELTKKFKIQAINWEQSKITDKNFLEEIEVLFESGVIEIDGINSFQEIQLDIPEWVKQVVIFWRDNYISDEEFLKLLEYILQLEISNYQTTYG